MPDRSPSHPAPSGLVDLAASMRATWRDDEELWTRAAAQQWCHGLRIQDVAADYAARGDLVSVDAAGRRFQGVVVAVGDDRLDLDTAGGVVHVRLALGEGPGALPAPLVLRRIAPARAGGVRPPPALVTFRARLLELEAEETVVGLGSVLLDDEVVGRLSVGRDHVVVRTPAEVVVPACWVAYVLAGVSR